MIDTHIKANDHAFYSPKETSDLLGVSIATLYNYDRDGVIRHHINENNGRRLYSGKEINRVKTAVR